MDDIGFCQFIISKDDLKELRIVKVRGVKHTSNITAQMEYVHDIDSTRQLMTFLRAGRADVALTNTIDGLLELRELGIKDIVPSGPPLGKFSSCITISTKITGNWCPVSIP